MDLNNRRNSALIASAVGLAFLGIIMYSQFAANPSMYANRILNQREQKNLQFKNDPDSPVPQPERAAFKGLSYFEPDQAYAVPATFVSDTQVDTLRLLTSTGTEYLALRVGKMKFELQGKKCELTTFRYLEPGKGDAYFIPFSDLTSAISTYGGGRYLEIPARDPLIADFNLAYHPYCAYNAAFVCPLPPPENHLLLEVRAGEKLP